MQTTTVFDASTATVDLTILASFPSEQTDTTSTIAKSRKPKKEYTPDPYTIDENGRFVGHDGFVVPRNFVEFYERHPRYIRGFVRRKWMSAEEAEIEDRTSELTIHLMSLPEGSKYSEPGYNGLENGCQDRVQIFHPANAGGANASRFFNFINMCLANHFFSLTKKASSNPIRRFNTLSLYSPDGEGELVNDDYIFSMASQAYFNGCNYDRLLEDSMYVRQFVEFVGEHNPELVSVIDAISMSETFVDAQRMLGMTEKLFLRARNRIGVLHQCFEAGSTPPRQRKVYRSRCQDVVPSTTSLGALVAEVV